VNGWNEGAKLTRRIAARSVRYLSQRSCKLPFRIVQQCSRSGGVRLRSVWGLANEVLLLT
jgi:hypothetical protein